MIRTTLSLAIAALCSNAAYAVPQNATTTRIVIGGATATEASTTAALIDNVCAPGTTIDYYLGKSSAHWNLACQINAGTFGVAAGTSVLFSKNNGGSGQGATAVELGLPVTVLSPTSTCVPASVPVQSTPKGTSYNAWDCSGAGEVTEGVVPDWGISDVEPKMFRGALSILSGGTPTPLPAGANLDSRPTASLPFGLVATVSLVQALQAVQFPASSACNPNVANASQDNGSVLGSTAGNGIKDAYEAYATDSIQPVVFNGAGVAIPETPDANGYSDQPHRNGDTRECMPSVSLAEARSMLRGDVNTWSEIKVAGGADLFSTAAGKPWAPDLDSFALCRRTQGSGTHATIASQILRTECGAGASVMVEPDPTFSGFPRLVFGNEGSSNLGECLDDLETRRNAEVGASVGNAKVWAIGYQSVEKNPDLEEAYRFIKIDGQSPDMKNFVQADYWIFGATTVNRNDDVAPFGAGEYTNPVGFFAATDLMFERLVQELSDPTNLVDLNAGLGHPFGWSGFTGTKIGGLDTLPSFPFNADPTIGVPNPPLQTLTHVNPDTGVADMCFGPALRVVGTSPVTVVDEENAE